MSEEVQNHNEIKLENKPIRKNARPSGFSKGVQIKWSNVKFEAIGKKY